MNTPEKIVQTYLRLNGFFTMPHFSVLIKDGRHIDFLALRPSGSQEIVVDEPLPLDLDFFDNLNVSRDETVGLIVEVKGGSEQASIDNLIKEYVSPFFGHTENVLNVGFEEKAQESFTHKEDTLIVSLRHSLEFIKRRFIELQLCEERARAKGQLTKAGSWHLSEEFLGDLLYLSKVNPRILCERKCPYK